MRVRSLGREYPLEKEMETHSSILAWKTLWKEEYGQATVHGLTESNTSEHAHTGKLVRVLRS